MPPTQSSHEVPKQFQKSSEIVKPCPQSRAPTVFQNSSKKVLRHSCQKVWQKFLQQFRTCGGMISVVAGQFRTCGGTWLDTLTSFLHKVGKWNRPAPLSSIMIGQSGVQYFIGLCLCTSEFRSGALEWNLGWTCGRWSILWQGSAQFAASFFRWGSFSLHGVLSIVLIEGVCGAWSKSFLSS